MRVHPLARAHAHFGARTTGTPVAPVFLTMPIGLVLPLLLLAMPIAVACGVLLAGIVGLFVGQRPEPTALRAQKPVVRCPGPVRVVPPAFDDDEVTLIFDRVLAR